MAAVGKYTNTEIEIDQIRHMILNSVRSFNSRFKKEYGQLVLAVDAKESWRKKQFPYYKANRKTTRDNSDIDWNELYRCIDTVRKEIEQFLPYKVVYSEGAEADDIIGVLARQCIERQELCLIVSGDKDFIQLQANNIYVRQWDNAHQRWISHANPSRYLFEHVVKGDLGDGIPNALSPDDHFITKAARAKPIRKTALEKWWNGEEIQDLVKSPWFQRNVNLIDLRKTPKEMQAAIADKYLSQPDKNKSKLLSYFIANGLKNLTNNLGDF